MEKTTPAGDWPSSTVSLGWTRKSSCVFRQLPIVMPFTWDVSTVPVPPDEPDEDLPPPPQPASVAARATRTRIAARFSTRDAERSAFADLRKGPAARTIWRATRDD